MVKEQSHTTVLQNEHVLRPSQTAKNQLLSGRCLFFNYALRTVITSKCISSLNQFDATTIQSQKDASRLIKFGSVALTTAVIRQTGQPHLPL